jgi:hypothetical protein
MVLLTYMSIRDAINDWIGQERLYVLTRALPSDPVERAMLISPEIKELVDGPWQDDSMARRCGRLRADLEAFIGGDIITVAWIHLKPKQPTLGDSIPRLTEFSTSEVAILAPPLGYLAPSQRVTLSLR